MKWRMFIDDERFPGEKDCDMVVVRSVDEAKQLIADNGMPHYVSFDHDLGDNLDTGMDLAKWIVERDLDDRSLPNDFRFYVHSQNPVGKENIERLLDQYLSIRNSGS